ncbi:MAG TPA: hypothetical protein DEP82_20425 [Arthrobacter bacterium]|nr:hypothetical protein [Arthrobacter sp.]HAP89032.1 hypothetical protein [Arthrobacter sp.]HBH56874.1 hypothetical protein [Arthrobacter sp.]HCB60202.1 hypothetical protein [Arthrobacter sp.]HCC41809.1 hypothetical protein [Arthrobacter sp.]
MTIEAASPQTATDSLNARVGAEVRAWMARRGFRQRHLAEALDIPQSSVSLRLNGRHPFTFEELAIIATTFEISIAELLGHGLLDTKNPRPHVEDGDSGAKLLLLDLNQQPFD